MTKEFKARKKAGLFANLSVVGGFTLLSRLMGFARDVIFATHFGAGFGMDAFLVAFKIPNFGRRLFAEGAFSQSFVPVLAEYRANRSFEETQGLIAGTEAALGLSLTMLTAIGILIAPLFVWIFAPGFSFDPGKFELTAHLLRLTFPYLLFVSLLALAGGTLNAYGRFASPAAAPMLLNGSFIVAALLVAPHLTHPIFALAGAVLVAGFLQLLLQIPFLSRLHLLVRPRIRWRDPGVRRIFKLMIPVAFGASVTQVNLLVDTLIASFLATGSISWLYYSDRLMEFPLGVFGVALGTVILPRLASHHSRGETKSYSAVLDQALRLSLFAMPAAAVGLAALAGPIVATLFGYGRFNGHDIVMTRASLLAYAFGLTGFALIKVFAPAYFSRQDTRTPVRAGIVAVGVNLILNVALVIPWDLEGGQAPHAGLALATSIAAWVNAYLLWRTLRRRGTYQPQIGWWPFVGRTVGAALAMGATLWWASPPLSSLRAQAALPRVGHLLWLIGLGLAVYLFTFVVLGGRLRHFGHLRGESV